jgi:hypothetical protein
LFSLVTAAHAELFDVQKDWLNTYANTAAVAAGNDSWGNANGATAWHGGELSFNWTNYNISGQTTVGTVTTWNDGGQYLLNYYLPSTGQTSNQTTTVSTYTGYTVPFSAYNFTPGTTIQQQIGPVLANQLHNNQAPEGGGQSKMALPTNVSLSSFTPTSGTLQQIPHTEAPPSQANIFGFTTTAYAPTGSFTDGGGSVQKNTDGVFYDYGASVTTSTGEGLYVPTSSTSNTVTLTNFFAGASYVSWTAPQGGNVTVAAIASDHSSGDDGNPGFFIIDPSKGNFEASGAAQPGLLFSAPSMVPVSSSVTTGGVDPPATMQNYSPTSFIGGTVFDYNANEGGAYTPGIGGPTVNGSNDATIGLQLTTSNSFAVTAGETLYFVVDATTGAYGGHSNHAFGYGKDSTSISAQVNLIPTPEPGSAVLLALAGVGLVLAAWKRRRIAA